MKSSPMARHAVSVSGRTFQSEELLWLWLMLTLSSVTDHYCQFSVAREVVLGARWCQPIPCLTIQSGVIESVDTFKLLYHFCCFRCVKQCTIAVNCVIN